MNHLLTPAQQSRLVAASGGRDSLFDLDLVIAELKQKNPKAFHTNETLEARVFYNEPATRVPYKSVVVPYMPNFLKL